MRLAQWRPFDCDFDFPSTLDRLSRDLSIDLFEQDHALAAKMTVPGVDPEEIEVSLDGDMLTISGVRAEEADIDGKEYYSKEIRRGSFYRAIRLPKAVDIERATAQYREGMLTVALPIVEEEVRAGVRVPVQNVVE